MSADDRRTITVHNRIIAACAGSLMTSFAVNPFDVARVRMQQSSAVEHISFEPLSQIKAEPVSKGRAAKLKPYTISQQALSAAGSLNGAQLGVDVCCKDAFWYPSSITYCIATDADPCAIHTQKPIANRYPTSTYGVLRRIVQEEGGTVLWRGVSLMLMQAIPANVIYFIAYEQIRDSIKTIETSYINQIGPLVAGGAARALASSMVSPLELLKTRLQSIQVPQGENAMAFALKSVKDMIKIDGYRSLWSGLGLTLWRDVPFSSIYWLVVEAVRSFSPKRVHSNWEKFAESFASGIIGGVIASVITTPFDVAKTRRQLGHASCTSAHMSMPKFMGTILRSEGWPALFVGLGPRTFKIAPACAIMITSYEMGKRFLGSTAL